MTSLVGNVILVDVGLHAVVAKKFLKPNVTRTNSRPTSTLYSKYNKSFLSIDMGI
jgi:hypothetical protein